MKQISEKNISEKKIKSRIIWNDLEDAASNGRMTVNYEQQNVLDKMIAVF
jgi:hypothetical protein